MPTFFCAGLKPHHEFRKGGVSVAGGMVACVLYDESVAISVATCLKTDLTVVVYNPW